MSQDDWREAITTVFYSFSRVPGNFPDHLDELVMDFDELPTAAGFE